MSQVLCSSSVEVCPECGSNHDDLSIKQLNREVCKMNAYATCPSTRAPILFRVVITVYDESGSECLMADKSKKSSAEVTDG